MPEIVERVALDINVSTAPEAIRRATIARDAGFRILKGGLRVLTGDGMGIDRFTDLAAVLGMKWVADLKLWDSPDTVEGAVQNLVRKHHPPFAITMAITDDPETMRRAQAAAGDVKMLGVTALTTDKPEITERIHDMTRDKRVEDLAYRAVQGGLRGLVCSALEVGWLKQDPVTQDMDVMVTGTRSLNAEPHEQANTGPPELALVAGADWVVLTREFTEAPNPVLALQNFIQRVEAIR